MTSRPETDASTASLRSIGAVVPSLGGACDTDRSISGRTSTGSREARYLRLGRAERVARRSRRRSSMVSAAVLALLVLGISACGDSDSASPTDPSDVRKALVDEGFDCDPLSGVRGRGRGIDSRDREVQCLAGTTVVAVFFVEYGDLDAVVEEFHTSEDWGDEPCEGGTQVDGLRGRGWVAAAFYGDPDDPSHIQEPQMVDLGTLTTMRDAIGGNFIERTC